MAIYNYEALVDGKDIVKGKVEAADIVEAKAAIRNRGYRPTKVYEERVGKEAKSDAASAVKSGQMKALGLNDKIEFTSTLQILAASGIPMIESLHFISIGSSIVVILTSSSFKLFNTE